MSTLKFKYKILIAFVAAFVVVSALTPNEVDTENEVDTDKIGNSSSNTKTGLIWDIDRSAKWTGFTDAEKRIVRRGALKVLNDESNCAAVVDGDRSGSRLGSYFVTCDAANGGIPFNVFFTSDDVRSGNTLAVPDAFPETQSRQTCEQEIKSSVQYPSTVDIHRFLGYASTVHNNGNRTIMQEFTAKNGFGLELKFKARCLIMPNGSVEINIVEAR